MEFIAKPPWDRVPAPQVWSAVEAGLSQRSVPEHRRAGLRDQLVSPVDAVLLYGSWARGDANASSDLDIVAIGRGGHVRQSAGDVNVVWYSHGELKLLDSTLFGFHLQRDGVILYDTDDRLADALATLADPDPDTILAKIRRLSSVLQKSALNSSNLPAVTKGARYLLRSALYVKALQAGRPCFSVAEISSRVGDPHLVGLLSSHQAIQTPASEETLRDLRARLVDVVGEPEAQLSPDLFPAAGAQLAARDELASFSKLCERDAGATNLPYEDLPLIII